MVKGASSETRNTTSGVISSTVPVRASGVSRMFASRKAGAAEAVISVSMKPGWTVFTRMPRGPSSTQAAFDRPRSATSPAVYATG